MTTMLLEQNVEWLLYSTKAIFLSTASPAHPRIPRSMCEEFSETQCDLKGRKMLT